MTEETRIHEAGHAVVWMLEEEHLGPLRLVTAIPYGTSLGRVRGEEPDTRPLTPRRFRASARMTAAGAVAESLAGFNTPGFHAKGPAGRDGVALAAAAWLSKLGARSKRGTRFCEEAIAGAEFQLRCNWGAVLGVADLLLRLGTLTAPYGTDLARMELEKPPRSLVPDWETLERLSLAVEHVPELREQIEAALRQVASAA